MDGKLVSKGLRINGPYKNNGALSANVSALEAVYKDLRGIE